MNYLLTGLPRIRSAWFAALLTTDDKPCYHSPEDPFSITGNFGIADPNAACLYPAWAIRETEDKPVVVIARNPDHSRDALARWGGVDPVQMEGWDAMVGNYRWFLNAVPHALVVPYEALDSYEEVAHIYRHLTGRALSKSRFDIFSALQIEQHLPKAQARYSTIRTK
jgi:hypothetical protein